MNEIYQAVIDRLESNEAFFTEAGLEPVQHIDKYRGQYDSPQDHEAFAVPAVFYRWSAMWDDIRDGVQQGTINVELHVVLENLYSPAANSSVKEEALKLDEYYMRVNALIHGLRGERFTALKRRSDDPDNEPTNVIAHIIGYSCNFTDNSAYLYRDFEETQAEGLQLTGQVVQRGEFSI